MRMTRTVAALMAAAVAVGVAVAVPGGTAVAQPAGAVSWSPSLSGGDAVGVQVTGGVVRLDADRTRSVDAALSPDGHGDDRSPGLLTLPAREVAVPVERVEVAVEAVPVPAEGIDVDVRGLRADGRWTEWLPAEPDPRTAATTEHHTSQAVLPDPVTRVQARLVLIPTGPSAPDGPEVRGLTLTAHPAPPGARARDDEEPEQHRVFATREGLVGGTTANGHVIADRDLFVALPSRRALSPRNTSDYSVQVCAPNGRCAFAPVWDVGPWNTRDDYWNPSDRRQNWGDLPRGLPQAQAAKERGHNGGKDQFGRKVVNPAGIDLADGLFWDALGLEDNSWVTVDYLWTGDSPLATVRVDRRVDLRDAPDPAARIIGIVADRAGVPLQCVAHGWLRIGAGQFLPVASVPRSQWAGHLPACDDD